MLRSPFGELNRVVYGVRMSFVPVAEVEEMMDGRGLRVRIGDLDVGLYRVDGEIYAMEDNCPHAGFPLSKGQMEGCVVICEAHGWPFDVRSGFDPENADGFPIPCFAVSIRGTTIHVDIDDRINDPKRSRRTQP